MCVGLGNVQWGKSSLNMNGVIFFSNIYEWRHIVRILGKAFRIFLERAFHWKMDSGKTESFPVNFGKNFIKKRSIFKQGKKCVWKWSQNLIKLFYKKKSIFSSGNLMKKNPTYVYKTLPFFGKSESRKAFHCTFRGNGGKRKVFPKIPGKSNSLCITLIIISITHNTVPFS